MQAGVAYEAVRVVGVVVADVVEGVAVVEEPEREAASLKGQELVLLVVEAVGGRGALGG